MGKYDWKTKEKNLYICKKLEYTTIYRRRDKESRKTRKKSKKVLTFLAGYGIIVKRSREQDAKLRAEPKRTKKVLDKPKEMW